MKYIALMDMWEVAYGEFLESLNCYESRQDTKYDELLKSKYKRSELKRTTSIYFETAEQKT